MLPKEFKIDVAKSASGDRQFKHEARLTRRILYVVNTANFFVSHRMPIARAAQAQGCDVHVAVPDGPGIRSIWDAGMKVHPIVLTRSGSKIAQELPAALSLMDLYKSLRPDLVHHVTIKPILYGTLAARIARVPAVVNAFSGLGHIFTATGAKASLWRTLVTIAYRLILRHPRHRAIFQNRDDCELLAGSGCVRSRDAQIIKGSGVDLKTFVHRPEPNGSPVVVLPARLLHHKGVHEFVDAARRLKAKGVPVRMALVGDLDPGNPSTIAEPELRNWIETGTVEWWGYRHDMPRVMSECHIVCLPSYREGVPKALLEAAASGRPIVTTDTPGCRDVVRHGENGLLVPVGDAAALAEAIIRLVLDPDLRRDMGMRGRKRAEAEFSIEGVIAKHLSIYDELLGSGSQPDAVEPEGGLRSDHQNHRAREAAAFIDLTSRGLCRSGQGDLSDRPL